MPEKSETPPPAPQKPSESKNLISFEDALKKMTPDEKATFEQLKADYIKALDICKPVLRKLSVKREKLVEKLAFVHASELNTGVGNVAAFTTFTPWMLVGATLENLTITADAIEAHINNASIEELELISQKLVNASDDFGKRFRKFQRGMREKYSETRT